MSAAVAPSSLKVSPNKTVTLASPFKVIIGAVISTTVTVAVADAELLLASVAVKVTTLLLPPIVKLTPEVTQLEVAFMLTKVPLAPVGEESVTVKPLPSFIFQ